jgi:DNA-directed RNA polymerase III subunit RPC11
VFFPTPTLRLQLIRAPPSCPYCANQLGLVEGTSGNKFGCQTCPYEYPLAKRYMERTYLARKEVDDVLGGADSWKNVDSTASAFSCFSLSLRDMRRVSLCLRGGPARRLSGIVEVDRSLLSPFPLLLETVDCPKECGSDRAFFMQIQIRSADEPSTTFYKCVLPHSPLPFFSALRCENHKRPC